MLKLDAFYFYNLFPAKRLNRQVPIFSPQLPSFIQSSLFGINRFHPHSADTFLTDNTFNIAKVRGSLGLPIILPVRSPCFWITEKKKSNQNGEKPFHFSPSCFSLFGWWYYSTTIQIQKSPFENWLRARMTKLISPTTPSLTRMPPKPIISSQILKGEPP